MFIVYLMQWWYGPGWIGQWKKIQTRSTGIGRAYSGKTLLKTMFSPWKRIVSYNKPNAAIQQKLQGVLDNIISRLVGACVRFFTLLAELITLAFVAVFSLVLAVIWPLIPALSLLIILKGTGAI